MNVIEFLNTLAIQIEAADYDAEIAKKQSMHR